MAQPARGANARDTHESAALDATARAAPEIVLAANPKGGSGKTTLAITLAALGARHGGAALIDADPQGAALAWLGRRPAADADDPAATAPVVGLAAPIDPAARILSNRRRWLRALGAALETGARWIVVDAPGGAAAWGALSRLLEDRAPLGARAVWRVAAPVGVGLYDAQAGRRFLAELENTPAIRRGAVDLLTLIMRVRRKERGLWSGGEGPGRDAFGAPLAGVVAEISDHRAYGRLAAAGLGLFDAAAEQHVGAGRLTRLRRDWTPLLKALGLPAPRRLARPRLGPPLVGFPAPPLASALADPLRAGVAPFIPSRHGALGCDRSAPWAPPPVPPV